MSILLDNARRYAENVISGVEITTNEVKTQCEWFLNDYDTRQHDDDFRFYFDIDKIDQIESILEVITFATGFSAGQSLIEGLADFQCFFLVNVFGWRFKDNDQRMRYRDNTLWIPRKNGKTFLCAVVILLLLLTEQNFSEVYSISKDRELAGETKKALTQLITESEVLSKHFTTPATLHGKMKSLITNSTYQARTADANSNNGLRPQAIICDEMGAMTSYDNYAAMVSGQLSVLNPLRFRITTAYSVDGSIFLEEIAYLRKVYSGSIVDERCFALLYYADEENLWTDHGLEMSNPLRIAQNIEEIRDSRAKALELPSLREEFLTKHVNHFMASQSGEAFVDVNVLRKGKIDSFDFSGRNVWLGVDLALTTDNCAVAIATEEDMKIYADVYAFVPTDRIAEKNRVEKVNYHDFIREGKVFSCGTETVDYGFIEDMVLDIESKFGCTVVGISYDRYNCLSSAQRWERAGYIAVETKQHSSVLHAPTKLLQEKIANGEFFYVANSLLEINFQNARVIYDNNLNMYVNKKRSAGKIDEVAALVNSIYLLQQDVVFNAESGWGAAVL
ncbi:terminase large subunit [Paenibacillus sp. OV219]|uniref:terminase large subunit n=1 Tax=Paenibacillus sp. OV219 TaxID=1884377 RepID=UPI0008B5D377|nr:terminase TerL endonuclease subunit [Paenibacillus sp. OV219]SEN18908.1 Phage terminase-like protein, large subunit, contains N-terminal HTH domain [Paenibacillus sp. OV219]